MPQPVAVIRMATAASTRARAAIAKRKTRTMLNQGKTSDHATARNCIAFVLDHGRNPPRKWCLGPASFRHYTNGRLERKLATTGTVGRAKR